MSRRPQEGGSLADGHPQTYDEVGFDDLRRMLSEVRFAVRDSRRLIILYTLSAFAVGLAIAFASEPEYTATTRLLPYRSTGPAGSLGGLAGLAGVRLQSSSGENTISVDLYPEVARTLTFGIAVAESPVRSSSGSPAIASRLFLNRVAQDHWLPAARRRLSGLLGGSASDTGPSAVSPSVPTTGAGPLQLSRGYIASVKAVAARISVWVDKRNSIVTVTGTMPDPVAAADLVESATATLMRTVISADALKAQEHLAFVSGQLAAARDRYERSEVAVADYLDRNRAALSPRATVAFDRLQREKDVAFELYQQLSRDVEQARIRKSQDTPVFTVLEPVVVPTAPSKPRRARIVATFLALGLSLGVIAAILRRFQRQGQAAS